MKRTETQRGNIIVLILVAVALFAGLTFALSNSMQGGSSDELTDAQVSQYASEILTYASQAEAVVAQMEFNGASIDDIDPILPSAGTFGAGSNIYKLFHIDGGGLNYKPAKEPPFVMVNPAPTTQSAWVVSDVTNVTWTPTAADDIILTAFGIDQDVCAEINKKLTGSDTIPALTVFGFEDRYFAEDLGGEDFTGCGGACTGNASLCVSNLIADRFFFYSIIGSQ